MSVLSARAFDAGWSCVECGARGHHAIIDGWFCFACRADDADERAFRSWVQVMVWARMPCPCADFDIEEPGPHTPACPWSDVDYAPEDWLL